MNNKIQVDTKTFVRFWLVILGLGLLALIIWKAATGLLIVGISLFLAIAISPLVNRVASLMPGKGRKWSTVIAYVIVMVVLTAILLVIVPAVVGETTKFVANLPNMVEEVTKGLSWVNEVGHTLGITNLQDQLLSGLEAFSVQFVQDFGMNILNSAGKIGAFLGAFILIAVLTFLMLMQGPEMMNSFWRRLEGNRRAMKLRKTIDRMGGVVAKFASGEIIIGIINGFMTTLVVVILSIIFGFSPGLALPFGLITGVLCIVPMFGAFIGGVLVTLLLLISNVWAGLAFAVYYLVYMQIEANIVTPRVQSKGMHLPALLVLSVVTIGIYMFGLIGAIIAIPIAGCIKVWIEEYGISSDIAK